MENFVQRLRQTVGSGTLIANSPLALSIEGMNLKLLAYRRERVLAWSIIPISPSFLSGGFINDSPGLAGVIKTAVSKPEFAKHRRTLASLPAFHSVCRTLQLPNLSELRPEVAIPQQARRDIGYSAENALLFWQPLAGVDDQRRFFITSVPKEPIITLVKTLKLAGLQPDKVELTTFALSRAVNQPQAIIAAMEANSLDSIIVRDSIPLVTRSTFLGERPQDTESLPALVTDALERIMTFYNESHPGNPLPPDIPVYLLGSAVTLNTNIIPAVETALGYPVSVFEPPVLYPPDFPKTELAANIGLMLKEL